MNERYDNIIKQKMDEAKRRTSRKRGWIKLDKSFLNSSINYRMELDEQAVFTKLIIMGDEIGPIPGLISDNDFRPMPHEYIAHIACCPIEVLESVLKKGIADDSIYENSHGIFLIHFDDYQFTEYDRQKPYRQQKKDEKLSGSERYKGGKYGHMVMDGHENDEEAVEQVTTN